MADSLHITQKLAPHIRREALFYRPEFADCGPVEVWEEGWQDVPLETLEAVADALELAIEYAGGSWNVYSAGVPF